MKAPAWLLSLLTLILFVPACTPGNTPSNSWTDAELLAFIQKCERVELVFRPDFSQNKVDHPAETLELTDKDAIGDFVSRIALVPKKPCNCAHLQQIIFRKDETALRASICSHCFDICFDRRTRNFEMPKTLYETFQQLAVKHNKKTSFDPLMPQQGT